MEALFKHNKEWHTNVSDKKPAPNNSFECAVCDKTFSCQQNLNKHSRNVHMLQNEKTPSVLCPLCEENFNTVLIVEEHLTEIHNFEPKLEELFFESIEEFQAWKLNVEKEDLAFFCKKGTSEDKIYYECHRSGFAKSNGKGQKLKWSHTNKLGKCCPARMIICKLDKKVKVCAQRTHVGHSQSIRFLHLTKDDRDEIAGKLKTGVTFERILDDIRESVGSEQDLKRIHVVDKRDLYNIVKCYNLDRDIADKNDALSTEMWVQEQKLLGDDSPVLYFKMQGVDDGGPLSIHDFMIVIMTPYQRDVVVKYTNEKVAIDSTHKTTDHDFQLTTQLTVDEFGAGCPVAFCLSNRVDQVAMRQFFQSVKDKVGIIETKVFMSDDAPTYINAWCAVMSTPEHVLLCTWHVDKNWRNNLVKIKNKLKQSEVYKACRTLMEQLDVETFHSSLEAFLLMCQEDPDTQEFGDYFEKIYANRPEKWAFCYRIGLALNTNMFLEAVHKKLKYLYMQGRQNKRVDKCLGLLMRFARDMMFEKIIRLVKNKPTYRMGAIANSHHRSKDIHDTAIIKVNEQTWEVKSTTVGRGPYTVSINVSNGCPGCPLSCPQCRVCVHQFTCTCIDYQIKGNFCKHVHACIRISNENNLIVSTSEEKSTLLFEEHSDKIIFACEGQSVHIGNSVTPLTRVTKLLNIASGASINSTDQGLLKMIPHLEKVIQIARQHQVDSEKESSSISHFPELPANLPSHKNLDKQRFHSTKKKQSTTKNRLSKPTDMEKNSLRETMDNQKRSSEVIHTDFDHSYDASLPQPQKQ